MNCSLGDEKLHPRVLQIDFDAEIEVPKAIQIAQEPDDMSVVTTSPASDPKLEFILDPMELEIAARLICSSLYKKTSCDKELFGNAHVLELEHLPLCSQEYNTVSCPCVEMSHLASPDYQNDIRKLYFMICLEGNQSLGDEFLISMLISRSGGKRNKVCFLVPGLYEGGGCRKFWLCRAQFMNLFGLTQDYLGNLETRWMNRRLCSWNDLPPFRWSETLMSYHVGNKAYIENW